MFKEKIYTIPVTDAFKEDCECPICNLHEQLEQDKIEFLLGPSASYMEVDLRGETNKLGFCKKHYTLLNKEQNRLGLALILHTHMQKLGEDLDFLINSPLSNKSAFFNKSKSSSNSKLLSFVEENEKSCYICKTIDHVFNLYMDTIFYLWKKDIDFKNKIKNSKGFCINHFALLIDMAPTKLNTKDLKEFKDILIPLQKESYQRVMDDLEWFINKYDYRYKDEPWKTSKDAIPRAIKKISSLKI